MNENSLKKPNRSSAAQPGTPHKSTRTNPPQGCGAKLNCADQERLRQALVDAFREFTAVIAEPLATSAVSLSKAGSGIRERLIGTKQLREMLGVSPRTIFRMIASGELPKPCKVSGRNKWPLRLIQERFLAAAYENDRTERDLSRQ